MKYLIRSLALLLFGLSLGANAENESGAQLYQLYCTQCHGINGDGHGVNAASMDVLPRAHIDPVEMGARQNADLFKVIKLGGKSINKSVLMPAWGHNLDDEQVEKLVQHLRVLCKCGG